LTEPIYADIDKPRPRDIAAVRLSLGTASGITLE